MTDRLPKAPLDPAKIQRETGVQEVPEWIELFNGFHSELPEPFAVLEVHRGTGSNEACEALRTLKRNPKVILSSPNEYGLTRLWNINPVLNQITEKTNPGTAIDLGCGAGRDAVWLAANGWEVTAVDRLESNLIRLAELREAHTPNVPILCVHLNLNEIVEPGQKYDLVLLHYCWDNNYFELAKQCVAPKGFLSILAHSSIHRNCFGNPRMSKIMNPDELKKEGFETVIERNFWSIDRHSVSVVLQRQ